MGGVLPGRVLEALQAATRLRAEQPTAALGTWLQQVWRRLGGEACVDEAARANLDLLWSCLDGLPEGEQDLIGPALPAALARLTALPDPEADSACGVQLMTIHKSKGLEFEVVIVPEMQARTRNRRPEMLSWLERGLTKPDDSGAISEFLVAPQQSKGADRGNAKQWVDAVREERQQEEEKRVFYVAATRARNELHLFARPVCREDKNGELALSEPKDSLLAAAWPALKGEIEGRFEVWKEQRKAEQEVASGELGSLAASADTNLLVMASQPKPTILRRLPPAYRASEAETRDASSSTSVSGLGARRLYERHEGGLESRALGTAVHSLLEEMAKQRISSDWRQIRANLAQFEGRIAAQMRGVGVDPRQAGRLAAEAVRLALDASHDPSGQWILSPRREAASEARWAGVVGGASPMCG